MSEQVQNPAEEMTKEQLTAYGITTDSWVTLDRAYNFIGLEGDNNLEVGGQSRQFYFDTTGELLFVRHTVGRPKVFDGNAKPGFVQVSHDNVEYSLEVKKGGFVDSTVGIFHECVSFDCISGLFSL